MADRGAVGWIIDAPMVIIPTRAKMTQALPDDPVQYRDVSAPGPRIWHAAQGVIAGQCVDQNNLPLARRVLVHRDDDGSLAAETISDANTGVFSVRVDDYPATKHTVTMQPLDGDQRNAPRFSGVTPAH